MPFVAAIPQPWLAFVTILVALGVFGHQGAVPHLVEFTRTSVAKLRYAALDALDRLDPDDLEERIGHLARDEQSWIRYRYQTVVARRSGP